MTDNEINDKNTSYLFSHLGIIKLFAIWGILETVVFIVTKGDQFKALSIYMTLLIIITIIAIAYPNISEHLK